MGVAIKQRDDTTWVGSWSRVYPIPFNSPRRRFEARHISKGPRTLVKHFSTRKAAIAWLMLKGPIP